jgi:Uma2 family endonuclease
MVPMAAKVQEAGRWHPDLLDGEWTVELLEALPDDGLRYELIDGTLLVSPLPTPRHQAAIGELYLLLRATCPEDHFVFLSPLDWQPDGRTSLEPDLLVVRRDRIGAKNITQTPTLVIEVISPSSRRIDRTLKLSRYAGGGISHYWVVDPMTPSVDIYEFHQGEYRLVASAAGDESVVVTAPFPVTVTPNNLVPI